jgi:hypothetical protein
MLHRDQINKMSAIFRECSAKSLAGRVSDETLENVKTRIKSWHVSLLYGVQQCGVGEDTMC